MSRLLTSLILTLTLLFTACEQVNDERIPYAPVRITFRTVADWNLYGLSGDAASSRRYIFAPPSIREPHNFPYTALDYTGFGGVLLVADVMGNLIAFDLACPYEVRADVRVFVPQGESYAECPQCGSQFDIFTNYGRAISGPCARSRYALTRYRVVSGGALEYRVVTR